LKRKNLPLVSIILPTYENWRGLERAVNSVLNQTYKNFEVLIIDDASSRETRGRIDMIANSDARCTLHNLLVNSGPGAARRLGQEKARGEYVAFLDTDDAWLPEKLEVQINAMEDNRWDISHTSYAKCAPETEVISETVEKRRTVVAKDIVSYDDLLASNWIGCSTAIYRKSAFPDHFMGNMRTRQDYAFWLELLKNGTVSHGIMQALTLYSVSPKGLSANKLHAAAAHYQVLKNYTELSAPKRMWAFIRYAMRGAVKFRI